MRLTSILLVALALSFAGCAVNSAYHTEPGVESVPKSPAELPGSKPTKQSFFTVNCSGTPETSALKRSFHLGFIEFDNQGDFFNFAELTTALHELQKSEGHVLLITYVHGWQNNASVEGLGPDATDAEVQKKLNSFNVDLNGEVGDVQRFKHFLAVLANTPSLRGVHIYGIYLGWRGELIENPSDDPITKYAVMTVPRALTFWSREATATKMGDSSAFGITLNALRSFVAEKRQRVTSVFMGHSFGAKILEQAVTQWALRQFGEQLGRSARPEQERFEQPFADLVLFMNPASQSIYARRLTQILKDYPSDYYLQRPLFVAVSSTTDYATGLAFPSGTTLGTAFGAYRTFHDKTPQDKYLRSTSVNNDYLRNGEVDISDTKLWTYGGGLTDASTKSVGAAKKLPSRQTVDQVIESLQFNMRHQTYRNRTANNQAAYDVFLANGLVGDMVFQRYSVDGQPTNRTRYWLLNVNPRIIDGHSDIWSYNAMNLYARLFRLAVAPLRDSDVTK